MVMRVLVKFDQDPSSHSQAMSNYAVLRSKHIFAPCNLGQRSDGGQSHTMHTNKADGHSDDVWSRSLSHGSAMSNYAILQSKCIFDPLSRSKVRQRLESYDAYKHGWWPFR